ncbi:MAG TPA: efflux RND transporter periplasmic adaptor subunit [Actinophytocola sp.]|uniref:efflux RND transporter periplasmic adaptor subunit n=1 Tax=Actinophytocola sp. TaxID=1872138 RepID=UPI002DDD9011|nr:efflux RND transporter periplasmic adaptor subunit [Actinophytocola sp.]HEV2779496.1 efflux RND transporter periplasmic adaptor subunit [Actinophytocola sp.]
MRRNGRILAINGVLVLALAAAGWGAYVFLWPSGTSNAASQARAVPVSRTTVVETVSAAGTVDSAYGADVNFGTAGTVASIDVKVGDAVAAGQQLATLDSAEAKAKVKAAQSSLDAAEEDLADFDDSTDTPAGSGGQTQTETSLRAKVDQAELTLQQAKDDLAATVLTAPGAGTVTAVNGGVGQRVGGSTGASGSDTSSGADAFIVLTDLTNLLVKAKLAEIDVSKVKAGQEATVTVNALPDSPIRATVGAVDLTPTTTNNIVQFGVSLTMAQPPAGLRPGQSASVAITVAKAEDALAVPSAALRTAGGQSTVTVLSGGREETRPVQVGVRSEALAQITSGLAEGEEVVLSVPSTTSGGSGGLTGRQGGGGGGVAPGGGGVLIPGGGGR